MGPKGAAAVATAHRAAGLTDTDILIDAARGVANAISFLNAQRAASGPYVSIISTMELVAGCGNKMELARLQQFLQRVTVVPISTAASQIAYPAHGILLSQPWSAYSRRPDCRNGFGAWTDTTH